MNLWLYLILIVLPQYSQSATKTKKRIPANTNGINLQVLDEDFDASSWEKEGYIVKQKLEVPSTESPNPRQRDLIFRNAGLFELIAGWDHLDKDLLYLRAKHKSLEQLQEQYPQMPLSALEKLILLLKGEK